MRVEYETWEVLLPEKAKAGMPCLAASQAAPLIYEKHGELVERK